MAKTESTAVNELISLVQGSAKQPQQDPSADLFAEPKATKVQPPRMSNTIPPMRGAGEVAPLPRGRAPHGTSQHSLSQQPPPPARMKTASPARGTTIPPLPPTRASTPLPERTTRPSLPPPRPSSSMPVPRPSTSSMPALRNTPRATLPPNSMPTASPFDVNIDVSPFAAEPQGYPVVKHRPPSVDMTADVIKGDNWFDVSAKVEKLHEETWVGQTDRTRKRELARMLVVPAIVAASIGVAIGVYISYRGHGKPTPRAASTTPSITTPAVTPEPTKQIEMPVTSTAPDPNAESPNAATASAGGDQPQPPTKEEDAAKQQQAAALAVAHADDPAAEPSLTRDAPVNGTPQPAVATAPAVQEIKTTKGIVKLVDVRINSKPAGATVMLVDDGKTSFLGTTPLATSVDASKSYDVIFTLEGRPTQMAHLDPAASARVDITLPRASHHESKAAAPAAAPLADVVEKKPEAKVAEAKKPEAKKPEAKKAAVKDSTFDEAAELASLGEAPKKAAAPKADAGGEGTLMVSSKPPCEIYIDGKATGLTTPQKSIALSAGSHKVTFINAAENIKKTVSVSISADKPTKLIQDLMTK